MILTQGRLGRQLSTVFKEFFFEIAGPISIKFHMHLLRKKRKQVYIFGLWHMTKIASMPIYGKNIKHPLLENYIIYCLETWYVAFVGLVLQHLYINDDPGLTLTYFTASSKLGLLGF